MKQKTVKGGCLCGAVRYEGKEEPYNVTHCHCADCRRSAGAAFVTWASFVKENFRFLRGEPREIAFAGRLRSFCAECGTSLTFIAGPGAEEIDVTVASFDDPEYVSPKDQTWVCDRVSWAELINSLPRYERERNRDSVRVR
jgi:hypothetical protein